MKNLWNKNLRMAVLLSAIVAGITGVFFKGGFSFSLYLLVFLFSVVSVGSFVSNDQALWKQKIAVILFVAVPGSLLIYGLYGFGREWIRYILALGAAALGGTVLFFFLHTQANTNLK